MDAQPVCIKLFAALAVKDKYKYNENRNHKHEVNRKHEVMTHSNLKTQANNYKGTRSHNSKFNEIIERMKCITTSAGKSFIIDWG